MWVRLSQEVCVKERGSVALRLGARKRVRPSQGRARRHLGGLHTPRAATHRGGAGSGGRQAAEVRTRARTGARARRGGWRRHSKRHASRQNLQAPFAFKVSMIH